MTGLRAAAISAAIVAGACSVMAESPSAPSPTRYDWSGLAESIVSGKNTKYEQAYAIYRWLCDNIAYDTSYSIYTADGAYENRRGVCQAYSELFYRLGEAVGLKVDIISGLSKNPDGHISPDGHAWVFVYTNGNSGILCDATWGAGSVKGSTFTRSRDKDDSWFHVDPDWMIFSHYPDTEVYQLLDSPVSYSTFAALPGLRPKLADFGFSGADLLRRSRSGRTPDLPECYTNRQIKVLKMPLDGTLRVGHSYEFSVSSDQDYEFAIINDSMWHHDWEQSGSRQSTRFVPAAGGKMTLNYRRRGDTGKWTRLVGYTVSAPTATDISMLEANAPHKSPVLTSLENYNVEIYRKRGIDAGALIDAVRREGITKVPRIYADGNYRLNSVPLNGRLKSGQTYVFRFSPYDRGEWVIINGQEWLHDWTQDPATRAWVMTVTAGAAGSKLKLSFKAEDATDGMYWSRMEYEIAD